MGHRFLSPEWLEAAKGLLVASKEFKHAVAGQSATLAATVTDAPGGKPIHLYYEFHDGALTRAEVTRNGHAPPRASQFQVTGTYETFVRLQKGELSLQAAYFQRKVRLTGDFQRAIRFAPAFLKYHELVRKVETEF